MAEHTIGINYDVSLEGADEAIAEAEGLLTSVSRGIGLVSSFDYTIMAWQRSAEKADMLGFMRATLSTINLMRQLIKMTELATIAQYAYNTALAIGQALTPWGIVALGLGGAYVAGEAIRGLTTPPREPYNLGKILEEEAQREREAYLSSTP